MSDGAEEAIVIGPPSGDDWDFSPRPADAIADAHVTVIPEPDNAQPDNGQGSGGSGKSQG